MTQVDDGTENGILRIFVPPCVFFNAEARRSG